MPKIPESIEAIPESRRIDLVGHGFTEVFACLTCCDFCIK